MNSVVSFFDTYTLRARILPAMLAIAPALVLVLVIFPSSPPLTQVFSGLVILALLYGFADVARRLGKRLEPKLHAEAGGLPSIVMLRHRDDTFSEASKTRYLKFLGKKIGSAPPTPASEERSPDLADRFYKEAGDWLREHTRDTKKFGILFAENMTYGFRRNLYGLRILGLVANAITVGLAISFLYYGRWWHTKIQIGNGAYYVLIVALIHTIFLIFFVRRAYVLEASRQYARQLILCCETLITFK
nr:hypothetical protein [uncultured Roseococcus sp.]